MVFIKIPECHKHTQSIRKQIEELIETYELPDWTHLAVFQRLSFARHFDSIELRWQLIGNQLLLLSILCLSFLLFFLLFFDFKTNF